MAKEKKNNNKVVRFFIKLFLSLIYISVIAVLFYSSYKIYLEDEKIVHWKNVIKTNQYTYLEISQMSEAFAQIDNKQIHFIMEKEDTGAWHTYLIAIKKEDYDKYKEIIDYTYERTTTPPQPIKIYGYPVEISKQIKELAIKNITKFVPIENKIIIDNENFEDYLTNTYLDTTQEKKDELNYYVIILLTLGFMLFLILIYTIFEKDKTQAIEKKKKQKIKNNKKKTNKINNENIDETEKEISEEKETKKASKKQVNKNSKKEESKKDENKTSIKEKFQKEETKNTEKKEKTKDDDLEII